MAFASPGGNESVRPADLLDHLLVINVEDFLPNFETKYGRKDIVELTVHDIDDRRTYTDQMWFSVVLVQALKSRVGQMVLARMKQGVGRPGQNPPWVLEDESTNRESVRSAEEYLDEIKK